MCEVCQLSPEFCRAFGCCLTCSEPPRSCSAEAFLQLNKMFFFSFHWPRMVAFMAVDSYWQDTYRDFVC